MELLNRKESSWIKHRIFEAAPVSKRADVWEYLEKLLRKYYVLYQVHLWLSLIPWRRMMHLCTTYVYWDYFVGQRAI